ncbi:ABC transporter ATP-binding protein [Streptacidiphilus pinicola]|uniref:ABC transporter ATP-binding protein n=1 Tax=Streptacidiphilus pinicola TaxID=2219663 RepID=UPI0014038B2A|nr:ABC transporter ATP-binding protein [Streptacidiphilus pinicola]
MLLALLGVVLGVANPLLLQRIIDTALVKHHPLELSLLCGIMLFAVVAGGLLLIGQAVLNQRLGQELVHALRMEVHDAAQQRSVEDLSRGPVSDVQALLSNDIGAVSDVLTFAVQACVTAGTTLVASTIAMITMSWQITVFSVVLSILLNVLNNRYARRRAMLSRAQHGRLAALLQTAAENVSLSGALLGRTMAREAWQRERFEALSEDVREQTVALRLAGRTSLAVINIALGAIPVFAYWAAGTVLPGLSIGSVIALTVLQSRISMPVQQLLQTASDIQMTAGPFARIFGYLDGANRSRPVPVTTKRAVSALDAVSLEGVSYRYPDSSTPVIDALSVEVPGGSTLFVVGDSGVGKSTLALLVSGLIKPLVGDVRVGCHGKTYAASAEFAVLVSQDPALINSSIGENLRLARGSVSDAELWSALALACLDDFVQGLPEGLDTPVGEDGALLSSGQRQRLSLARAVLVNPPLLVIDEGLNAVPLELEQQIYENLRAWSPEKTLVFVSHRLPRLRGDELVWRLLPEGGVALTDGNADSRKVRI